MNPSDAAAEWTAVADAWDAHADDEVDPTTPATDALVDRLAVRPGDRVLELTAGPGSLGSTWSTLVGDDGTVLISDLAPGMVDVARRRNAPLDNVTVGMVDASAIDRPDGSFNVVASSMGLMFTPDPAVAFAEIHRVLAPGGRMAMLTWAGLEHNPWLTCVGMAAMMNGLVTGGPPVGPGAIFSLGDPALVGPLVGAAGFVDVQTETVGVTFSAETVDAHVAKVASMAGPLSAVIEAASPEQQASLRRTASDLAAQYVTDAGVAIPGRALLTSAHKP